MFEFIQDRLQKYWLNMEGTPRIGCLLVSNRLSQEPMPMLPELFKQKFNWQAVDQTEQIKWKSRRSKWDHLNLGKIPWIQSDPHGWDTSHSFSTNKDQLLIGAEFLCLLCIPMCICELMRFCVCMSRTSFREEMKIFSSEAILACYKCKKMGVSIFRRLPCPIGEK